MSVRKRLAEDATKNYEKIERALLERIEAKKDVWVTRRYCNKRTQVQVADQSARNRAVEIYLDQGFGRTLQEEPVHEPDPLEGMSLEQLKEHRAIVNGLRDGLSAEGLGDYLREKEVIVMDYGPVELREMVKVYKQYKRERNGAQP